MFSLEKGTPSWGSEVTKSELPITAGKSVSWTPLSVAYASHAGEENGPVSSGGDELTPCL